jgi:hypothetical protein
METQGSISYNDGYGVSFIRNGSDTFELKFPGRDERYGNYSCNSWHKVELRVDVDSNRYQLLVDGSAINTVHSNNLDNRGIQLWSCNLNDSGAQRTVYFDEVLVKEGDYNF